MLSELCIVENSIIHKILAKNLEEFLNLFAEEEKTYCFGGKKWEMHLTARFAAKKAVYKLLGARAEIQWNTIVIRHDSSGAPHIILKGIAAEHADDLKVMRWHLSLTHTDQYAAAFVVAEGLEGGKSPLT